MLKGTHLHHKTFKSISKRKRGQDAVHHFSLPVYQHFSHELRISQFDCTAKLKSKDEVANTIDEIVDSLEYWTRNKTWPKVYFDQDSQVKKDFEHNSEQDSWLEEMRKYSTYSVQYVEIQGFRIPRPVRKLPTSARRKKSDSSLTESSNSKTREAKSAPYSTARYILLLESKGSHMKEFRLGATAASLEKCITLLDSEQAVPKDTLFRDDLFRVTCEKVQDTNEARVIRSISPYIVPSAEDLETLGATHLEHLIEGINETWVRNIAVEGPLPKPDYSVGFKRSAFSDDQLKKLYILVGTLYENSFFASTWRMYFPFLTCEVKCGATALDIADRQNAHSMTVAVRALVELFRAVGQAEKLNREILTFSVSHDHKSVRIFGHYPVIEGNKITYYRHAIRDFCFTELNGREKWAAYKFVKNIYDIWMPQLHRKICSALDDLPPDINFGLSQTASFSSPSASQQLNTESVLDKEDG